MSNIILTINRISKKINSSSGDSYLYKYFDELVEMLQDTETLSASEIASLRGLIQNYAADSIYNNYASANWMRYSARCFYCSDFLIRFLGDKPNQEGMVSLLNSYFKDLVEHGVAPITESCMKPSSKRLLMNVKDVDIGKVMIFHLLEHTRNLLIDS